MKPGPLTPLPRWIELGALPAANLLLALGVTAVVMVATGHSPQHVIGLMIDGAFGSAVGWGYTLYYATTFVFTGLAVSMALHAGLFNIGVEGQATVGGLALGAVILGLGHDLPAWGTLALAAAAAAAAGGLWALLPAYLQAWRGSQVVITTIMFNFLASSLAAWLIVNVMREPGGLGAESAAFADGVALPSLQGIGAAWGVSLPNTPLNLAVVLALMATGLYATLVWRTPAGFALRTFGQSPPAASFAGYDAKRLTLLAMGLSGAIGALMALNEIAGVHHKVVLNYTGGAGFTGIAVALMSRGRPLGILFAALLFGALQQGGAELSFEVPTITRDLVIAVQGLVVLFCGAFAMLPRPLFERLANAITRSDRTAASH